LSPHHFSTEFAVQLLWQHARGVLFNLETIKIWPRNLDWLNTCGGIIFSICM